MDRNKCGELVSEPQTGEDPLFSNALGLQKPRNIMPLYDRGEIFQKEGKSLAIHERLETLS